MVLGAQILVARMAHKHGGLLMVVEHTPNVKEVGHRVKRVKKMGMAGMAGLGRPPQLVSTKWNGPH